MSQLRRIEERDGIDWAFLFMRPRSNCTFKNALLCCPQDLPDVRGMSREEPSDRRVATLRLMELRWQREVIERWLLDAPVPQDSRRPLEELLSTVDEELSEIEAELRAGDTARRWN
jgi:hypothetical protein